MRVRATSTLVVGLVLAALASATPSAASRGDGSEGAISKAGVIRLWSGGNCQLRAVVPNPVKQLVLALVLQAPNCLPRWPSPNAGLVAISTVTNRVVAAKPMTYPAAAAGCDNDPSTQQAMKLDGTGRWLYLPCSSGFPSFPSNILVFDVEALLKPGRAPIPASRAIAVPSSPAQLAAAGGGTGLLSGRNPAGPAGDSNLIVSGLSVDSVADSLYVVLSQFYGGTYSTTASHGSGTQDVYVARLRRSTGDLAWAMTLDGCTYSASASSRSASVYATDPVFAVRSSRFGQALVVGCIGSRGVNPVNPSLPLGGVVTLAGGSAVSYLIPLDSSLAPVTAAITYRQGRPNTMFGVADPHGGRIFWNSPPPVAGAPPAAVVFDAARNFYVGASTVGSGRGVPAMAVAGGRLYAVDTGGIRVFDATATPPGQAAPNPVFACYANLMVVDAASRKLFVQPYQECGVGGGAGGVQSGDLLVFRDRLPSVATSPPVDPDMYTSQLKEGNRTGVAFNGHAEATALRMRLVGGSTGFAQGASLGVYSPEFLCKLNNLNRSLPCLGLPPDTPEQVRSAAANDYSTREIKLGVIEGADLGEFQASAVADSSTADAGSARQLGGWAAESAVACSGQKSPGPSRRAGPNTVSQVSCDPAAGLVRADSSADGADLVQLLAGAQAPSNQNQPFAMGHGSSSASVRRDKAGGLVSTVTGSARNVSAGPVTIGQVTATAVCKARGRTGSAACSYNRKIEGLTGLAPGAPTSCEEGYGAGGGGKPPTTCAQLLAAMNQVSPGYLVFTAPAPDERRNNLAGSPGGYQSVAQRNYYQHLEDSVLNYDDSTQIPGLEILYVNDSYNQPSRLDVQLANVEAEAHYGISLLPSDDWGDRDEGGAVAGPRAPGAGTGDGGNGVGPLDEVQGPGEPGGAGVGQVLRRALAGLRWLVRSPAQALLVACLLSLLAQPFLLAIRRARLQSLEGVA